MRFLRFWQDVLSYTAVILMDIIFTVFMLKTWDEDDERKLKRQPARSRREK